MKFVPIGFFLSSLFLEVVLGIIYDVAQLNPPIDSIDCPFLDVKVGKCTIDDVLQKLGGLTGKDCDKKYEQLLSKTDKDGKKTPIIPKKKNSVDTSKSETCADTRHIIAFLEENGCKANNNADTQILAECTINASTGGTTTINNLKVYKLTDSNFRTKFCCTCCKKGTRVCKKQGLTIEEERRLQESDEGDDDSGECCPDTFVYGEPHFATWKGHYNYHGACDLVLLTSDTFNNGTRIDLHARTEQMEGGYYSFMSDTVLRIDEDVLEVHKDRSVHYNMNPVGPEDFPLTVGGFLTTFTQENKCFDIGQMHKCVDAVNIKVQAGINDPEGYIMFKVFTDKVPMVHVQIKDMFYDLAVQSYGMLGNHFAERHGRVARDKVTLIEDPNDFAQEWQVRDTDPNLFSESRYPQFPDSCVPRNEGHILDEDSPARKLRNDNMHQLARNVCSFISHDHEKHKNCIFDVMSTEDEAAAIIYHTGW